MTEAPLFEINVSRAQIIWDGDVGGRDGNSRTVYKIKINGTWLWFIGDEYYEIDGNKFKINISSFGASDKISLESSDAGLRKKFDPVIAAKIKRRLCEFYLGPEKKMFFPFTHPKSKCVDITFEKDWILLN